MNSALKAGILTLIIVAIGFGLMSFLGDDDGGPSDQGIRDRRPPWILDRSGEYPSHFKFEIHLGAACGNVAFFLRREAPGDGLEAIGEVLQTRDLIETRRVRDRHDAIFFLHILQFEQHLKPLLKRRFPLDTLLKCSDLCIRHRLAKRTENGTADRHP